MSEPALPSRPIAELPRSAAMRLDIIPERPCLPVGEVTSLPVLIRLTAPTVPQMARKPLNLCLVIDRSGSMAGEKLRHTIASAKFVVERLAATDVLSVVQFDERVKVVIPPGPVTDRRTSADGWTASTPAGRRTSRAAGCVARPVSGSGRRPITSTGSSSSPTARPITGSPIRLSW